MTAAPLATHACACHTRGMSPSPTYLPQLMRVARHRRTPGETRAREALALAITEHNRRVRSAGATRVP